MYNQLVKQWNLFVDLFLQIKKNGIKNGYKEFKTIQKWLVKKVSYGKDYPDKTFYVIRRYTPDAGVFSYMNSCVTNFKYCEEHGYIPVVDLQNNRSIYLTKKNVGKLNAWEFFFEQPAGYTLKDIKHAKNVILNGGGYQYGTWPFDIFTADTYADWRPYCHKYIKFSKEVIEKTEELKKRFFKEDDIICGVLCRGKAYTVSRISNHPVQPDIDDVVVDIKRCLNDYGCNKIYLATEERSAYDYLKSIFGEKLVSVADFSDLEDIKRGVIQMPGEQAEKIQKGINYAASVRILSDARCLVGGNTSGTIAAEILSDGYDYDHIFDLGRY